MVGNYKETVRFHEETVAFRKATDWLKKEKSVKYYVTEATIGMNEGQMDMVRAFRRRVTKQEVKALIEKYPETVQFFETNKVDNTSYENQTLNEPMGTHFYGKSTDHRDELIDLQKKLIARLEAELEEVKSKLKEVEGQNKVLVEIVSQRK